MLLPDPLRNGYMHTPSQMVTEHDGDAVGTLLFEGVLHVVDEWQRHLIHIGALVWQEAAILATLCDRTTWIHDATNSSATGWQGGKERNLN